MNSTSGALQTPTRWNSSLSALQNLPLRACTPQRDNLVYMNVWALVESMVDPTGVYLLALCPPVKLGTAEHVIHSKCTS